MKRVRVIHCTATSGIKGSIIKGISNYKYNKHNFHRKNLRSYTTKYFIEESSLLQQIVEKDESLKGKEPTEDESDQYLEKFEQIMRNDEFMKDNLKGAGVSESTMSHKDYEPDYKNMKVEKLLTEAENYENDGNWNAALEDYNNALSILPKYTTVLVRRGRLYYTLNKHKEALEDFNSAFALAPNSIPVVIEIGKCLVKLGLTEQALQKFDQVLSLDPYNVQALEERSELLLDISQPNSAKTDLTVLIQESPESYRGWMSLGKLSLYLSNFKAARIAYQFAIKYIDHKIQSGDVPHSSYIPGLKRYLSEAYSKLASVEQIYSQESGMSLTQNQNVLNQVLQNLTKSIEISKEIGSVSIQSVAVRSSILLTLGRLDEAIADCDQVLGETDNKDVYMLYLVRGQCYLAKRLQTKALEDMKKYLLLEEQIWSNERSKMKAALGYLEEGTGQVIQEEIARSLQRAEISTIIDQIQDTLK